MVDREEEAEAVWKNVHPNCNHYRVGLHTVVLGERLGHGPSYSNWAQFEAHKAGETTGRLREVVAGHRSSSDERYGLVVQEVVGVPHILTDGLNETGVVKTGYGELGEGGFAAGS